MSGNIVFVDSPLTDSDLARRIAPSGFELRVVDGGSPEYEAALGEAEYLVGFVAGLVCHPASQLAVAAGIDMATPVDVARVRDVAEQSRCIDEGDTLLAQRATALDQPRIARPGCPRPGIGGIEQRLLSRLRGLLRRTYWLGCSTCR